MAKPRRCIWSTTPRFLLARNVKYRKQKLIFDDDVIKHLSKICKPSYESRHPCHGKPSKIVFALWTQLEVAVAGPKHQTTSILFIFGVPTKWYFLLSLLAFVLLLLKTVSRALQFAACPVIVARVTHGIRVMTVFFCVACACCCCCSRQPC